MRALVLLLLAAAFACDRRSRSVGGAAAPSVEPAVGHVDSILPIGEALNRFRDGAGSPPDELTGGAPTAQSLIARFGQALSSQDTTTLRKMVLSRAEYAYLYYPSSRFTRPPYRQDPALNWFLMQQNSEKGISRALRRFGGTTLLVSGLECKRSSREGQNIFHECTVRLSQAGEEPRRLRVFGSILERNARYKFVTYANDL